MDAQAEIAAARARRWAERDAKREREECEETQRREADRVRRGKPQRFIIKGPIFFGSGDDRGMALPSIDPPLERDESIEVVEAAAFDRAVELLELAQREINCPEDHRRVGIPVHAKIRYFLRNYGRSPETRLATYDGRTTGRGG